MGHLMKHFGIGLLTMTLGAVGTTGSRAQEVSYIIPTPKAELLQTASKAKLLAAANNGLKANYKTPVPLANLGTISQGDNASCNYLFKHKDINGGAWLLASSDKKASYVNQSTGNVTSYQWTVPGSSVSSFTSSDIQVSYSKPGIYAMPTLTVGNGTETNSYTAPYTIKVGGTSEITTIDCREWGSTYMLSSLEYGNGQGYVGGTNSVDIVGWGNLFMLGTDEAFLDGINVYLLKKPTKYKDGAKLIIKVWMTNITDKEAKLIYLPVEAATVYMKDIKADGEDGAWCPVYDGALAQVKFSEPLSMYGKTTFFVSVEGFSNDPSTEDFVLLKDMVGKQLDETQVYSLLSHNSFARQKGETDYLRPINMYGGGTGSFAICPIIRIPDTAAGINAATTTNSERLIARFSDSNTIEVTSPADGRVTIVDAGGATLANGHITNGKAQINVPNAGHGLYIVSGPNGQTAKILR